MSVNLSSIQTNKCENPFITPYSKHYAYRASKIKENRNKKEEIGSEDIINTRGRSTTIYTNHFDESKLHSSKKTFGIVRSLSREKTRPLPGKFSDCSSSVSSRNSINNNRSKSADIYTRIEQNKRGSILDKKKKAFSTDDSLNSFKSFLNIQRDVDAQLKLDVSILRLKKEQKEIDSKLKNTNIWIPGGRSLNSPHRFVNKAALEKSSLHKAWRKGFWPSTLQNIEENKIILENKDFNNNKIDSISNSYKSNDLYSQNYSKKSDDNYQTSPSNYYPSSHYGENKNNCSPQVFNPNSFIYDDDGRIDYNSLNHFESILGPPKSNQLNSSPLNDKNLKIKNNLNDSAVSINSLNNNQNNSSNNSISSLSSKKRINSKNQRKNSTNTRAHIVLTCDLIDRSIDPETNKQGIVVLRRGSSKIDIVRNVEQQFNVVISDLCVTSSSIYSNAYNNVRSLSTGTLEEIPILDENCKLLIYVGGISTILNTESKKVHKNIPPTSTNSYQHSLKDDQNNIMMSSMISKPPQLGSAKKGKKSNTIENYVKISHNSYVNPNKSRINYEIQDESDNFSNKLNLFDNIVSNNEGNDINQRISEYASRREMLEINKTKTFSPPKSKIPSNYHLKKDVIQDPELENYSSPRNFQEYNNYNNEYQDSSTPVNSQVANHKEMSESEQRFYNAKLISQSSLFSPSLGSVKTLHELANSISPPYQLYDTELNNNKNYNDNDQFNNNQMFIRNPNLLSSGSEVDEEYNQFRDRSNSYSSSNRSRSSSSSNNNNSISSDGISKNPSYHYITNKTSTTSTPSSSQKANKRRQMDLSYLLE
jgi:hypothetical protein